MYCSFSPNFFSVLLLQTFEPENQSFKKKKYYSLQLKLKIDESFENAREIRKKTQFFNFRAEIFFPS